MKIILAMILISLVLVSGCAAESSSIEVPAIPDSSINTTVESPDSDSTEVLDNLVNENV